MASNFNLYHLTLQPPTVANAAVVGNFSASDNFEIVVARGTVLEVLRRDSATSLLRTVHRETCFGSVRALATVRVSGQSRDILVVTSDSGKLSFLKFNGKAFEVLYCETYGKSGIRRIVPGEYMATDPAGRAVMIASIEKEKFVFGVNRDSEDQLYISSPLEAHKSNAITFAIVGLDVGYDNPVFAAIETVYEDEDEGKRFFVLYEVDLGLNHVLRKWSKQVSDTANHLIAVPNGGCIVCSADGLEFVKKDEPSIKLALPKREWDDPSRDALVISSTNFQNKDVFFTLLQTERGDVFKLSLESHNGKASGLIVKYFDSIAPANNLCLSKNGFLFVASEFGNQELYEVIAVGDSPDDNGVEIQATAEKPLLSPPTFVPRDKTLNLELFDVKESLAPILGFKACDLAKEMGVLQLYTLCGRAEKSSLRVLRQGHSMIDAGNIRFASAKGDVNRGVFTIRDQSQGEERLIIISQKDSTKVFVVKTEPGKNEGDPRRDIISEDASPDGQGIQRNVTTIAAGVWGRRNAPELVQVTSHGWRYINYSTGKVLKEYKVPLGQRVEVACVTNKQICLAMPGGQVLYFEEDESGQPVERGRRDFGVDIACMDCDAAFLAIGGWDSLVRIVSLDKSNRLADLSSQKVPSKLYSLCLIRDEARGQVRLEIGLQNGILVRSILDIGSSGAIVDTRSHVLGSRPVKVQKVLLIVEEYDPSDSKGAPSETVAMCCSSRPWLARAVQPPSPLSFRPFEFVAPFKASAFDGAEGMVALGPGSVLSITMLDNYGLDTTKRFTQAIHKLERTPRRLVVHPTRSDQIVLIEGDRDSYLSAATAAPQENNAAATTAKPKSADDMDVDEEEEGGAGAALGDEADASEVRGRIVGHPRRKNPDASWASCVRVINPMTGQTLQRVQLSPNEMAVSIERAKFAGDDFIFVGTVTDMRFHPRTVGVCSIRAYKVLPAGGKLELVHTTKVDDVPLALSAFDDRLLCGAGQVITLYDMGTKQLLRKCELRNLPSLVTFIKPVSNDRLIVGDSHESVYFVHFSKQDNTFSVFADDITSRMCVAGEALDPNTCVASDKFGSVFVVRLPPGATGNDPRSRAASTRSALWDQSTSGGVPHHAELLAHFYVGDVVTSLQKCTLAPDRTETLLYGTVMGGIGSLSPFASRDDLDFFAILELNLRKNYKNVLGRDHLQFRSYFAPVKGVIDGDLCEVFIKLPEDVQSKVAKAMDRTVEEVSRRIEEMRSAVMW